jgi:hypothetical protein
MPVAPAEEANPEPRLLVAVGTHVEVELIDRTGARERLAFDVVPDRAADFAHGCLGEGTPLAKAILGQVAGSRLDYRMDDTQAVLILSVAPAAGVSTEAANRRQAALEKTVKQLNRTNAAVFAASYNGKWGDYDPEGVEHWEE